MKRLNFKFADILFFDSYFCFITKIASNNSPNDLSEYRRKQYKISNCFHYDDIDGFINEIRYSLSSNCGYSISKRELNLLKSSVLNTCKQNQIGFPDEVNQNITGLKNWKEQYIIACLSKNNEMLKLLSHSPIEKIYLSILDRQDIPNEAIATIFHRLDAQECCELACSYINDFKTDDFSAKEVAIISALFSHPDSVTCLKFAFLAAFKSIPDNIKLMLLLNPIARIRYNSLSFLHFQNNNSDGYPQYILEFLFAKHFSVFNINDPEDAAFGYRFTNNISIFLQPFIQSRLSATFKNNLEMLPSYKELLVKYYNSDILSLT